MKNNGKTFIEKTTDCCHWVFEGLSLVGIQLRRYIAPALLIDPWQKNGQRAYLYTYSYATLFRCSLTISTIPKDVTLYFIPGRYGDRHSWWSIFGAIRLNQPVPILVWKYPSASARVSIIINKTGATYTNPTGILRPVAYAFIPPWPKMRGPLGSKYEDPTVLKFDSRVVCTAVRHSYTVCTYVLTVAFSFSSVIITSHSAGVAQQHPSRKIYSSSKTWKKGKKTQPW